MANININSESCTKCGKCVKVCPAWLFSQDGASSPVEIPTAEGCIVCGHCVAACPTDSITHSDFPADKVHPIDYAKLPTPEQLMLLAKARRSNRAFSKKQIPEECLDMILEAAHRAPTASNLQRVEFTLVTDPDNLRKITDCTLDIFGSIVKRLENPILKPILKMVMAGAYKYVPNFHKLIAENAKGNDLILRGATAVIFIHTPENSHFGAADANLAYQNASLMAESLGVSQFYTGFVCVALKQDNTDTLAEALGIKGTIHAGMALGMPSFRMPNYIDRKDIVVHRL